MDGTESFLIKRFIELAERSYSGGCYTNSEFLTLSEQSVLVACSAKLGGTAWSLEGGHPACERKLAFFGSEEQNGYALPPPIACVMIEAKNERFAEPLTHRDFLGALMNLGLRREVLGDIFPLGVGACVFCLDSMAQFIADSLERVGHTTVLCRVLDRPPQELEIKTESVSLNVPSERIDAVIGEVWRLSRSQSGKLFESHRVFVNSRQTENTSYALKPGDIVSVRGLGRFTYSGIERNTKKGRLFVGVELPVAPKD